LARRPGDRQASNSDRLDRSQVEIKANRDTTAGFITLDRACKKNPKRPQIEASRRKNARNATNSGFRERQQAVPAVFAIVLLACFGPAADLLSSCF